MEAIYVDLHIHTSENADNLNKSYNIDEAIDIVFNIDYLMQRRFIVYLIEYRDKERELEKEKELIRDREKAA